MTLQTGEMTVTADVKDLDKEEYMLTFSTCWIRTRPLPTLWRKRAGPLPPPGGHDFGKAS